MFFTLLLGLSAFLVAGSAAYFSVLGIATLFAGSYYQVMVMAGSLEFGKLVATSFLYRYWKTTPRLLRNYLIIAVVVLMGITSLGIFGYLSAAYQVNSGKFEQIDNKIALIENQKTTLEEEITLNSKRIETLNEIRITQEQRVKEAGNYKTPREQAYAAIDKASSEVKEINERTQKLREEKFKKDEEIVLLKQEIGKAKDIGTFKFVAEIVNKPLDSIVMLFISLLIAVFDPLAVSLVLAFNVATKGSILKEKKQELIEEFVEESKPEPITITTKGKFKTKSAT
jgi:hypothetical protein